MSRRSLVSLVLIVAVAAGLLIASLVAGNRPLLGLDLKGGVEVVLVPVDDPERPVAITEGDLDTAVNIIRDRIDGLGVAEPDVTRQGGRVVVQLPGISDQQRAIDIVGQTAELRFRPVCAILAPEPVRPTDPDTATDTPPTEPDTQPLDAQTTPEPTDTDTPPTEPDTQPLDAQTTPEPTDTDTPEPTDTQTPEPTEPEPDTGTPPTEPDTQTPEPTDTDTPEPTDTQTPEPTEPEPDTGTQTTGPDTQTPPPELPDPELDDRGLAPCPGGIDYNGLESSTSAEDLLDRFVVLPQRGQDGQVEARYLLGPSTLTGAGLNSADRSFRAEFVVDATFKGGQEGADKFDEIAAECYSGSPYCPPGIQGLGQLAIVVDGNVQSAPTVQTDDFDGQVVISGGFSEQEADDLALVLRYGALPIEFQDPTDPQSDSTSRAVSATIGGDSLRAGVIAGIVGLVLVFLFMVGTYRLLGLVAMLSLGVSATLLWVIVAWLGETQDLALTLAGVTGLIVSIGVSLDSNVVYFEHLKEDVATGRTLRSSLEQSFPAAFKTIFWANFASLIAAVILYWLSAGSVRGFALMLGLASVLDLVATYFFLRPCALLMARSPNLVSHPRRLGLPPMPEEETAAGGGDAR